MFSKQKILPSQSSSSLGKREYDSICPPSRLSKELESSDLKHSSSSPGKRSKLDHNDEPEIVSLQHHSSNLPIGLIIGKAKTETTSSKIGKKPKVRRLLLQTNFRRTYHRAVNRVHRPSGKQRRVNIQNLFFSKALP